MKLLITGGAGFIGINFCHYIKEKHPQYNVVCLDKLTYASNFSAIKSLINNTSFKFVKGDICNKKLVEKLFKKEKFDVVINFAGESHVDRSITNPSIFLQTNVFGVKVLLDACKKYRVYFHQVSTDEVYGGVPTRDKTTRFDEGSPLKPTSPYSASKASADLLVLSYFHTYNLPITISRSANNYGKYQYHEKLVPITISRLLQNQEIEIYGDGKDTRNWIYVLDHCQAIDLIIHKGEKGEIYNVGSANEFSNLKIIDTICKHLKNKSPKKKFVNNRPCHDPKYPISFDKISRTLGYSEMYNFSSTFADTIDWYAKNQQVFKK